MSKSKQLIILSIISVLIFTFAIIISCEKSPTISGFVFEPKEYLGTYSVEQFSGINLVFEIDTVKFDFRSGGLFTMRLLVDTLQFQDHNQDRDFCDVTGEYSVSGNKLEIVINYIYSQTCDQDEIPEDKYIFYGRTGEIVLDGLDENNQDLDRQIILWLEEE